MTFGRVRSAMLPAAWIVLSAIWVVAIVVTDHPAWPVTVWIAITIGPIITLGRRSHRPPAGP